ncbi:MAG: hypothetical protein IT554_06795 [Sphingomonadaceae bacterium]|jgi:hypothetical protein|nr:hypothetical protein [Sphingomonadaceae bacterium]
MATVTTLSGLPGDYTFKGGLAIHRSGAVTSIASYDQVRFSAATFKIVGDKLVPTFTLPGSAIPALSAQDQADLALGREVRRLVKP